MDRKILSNASWIIGCRIVQSILAFLISLLTARYLGPSNFGLISYAQSITTFVVPIMQLGLNSIIVRELINNPEKEGEIVGTSITMSLVSCLFCVLGIYLFTSVANKNETETIIVCLLYSISLFFQSIELVRFWFQAKYLSKYPSIVSLVAYTIVSAYKFYLLASKKSVRWFAVSYALDSFIIVVALLFIYRSKGGRKFNISLNMAKKLLSSSKYYIISSLMITVFLQTDRIMLKLMINDSETGFYAAAATCTGMAGFVFTAINDSLRPYVLENKKYDMTRYEQSVIDLYSIILGLSLVYASILTVLSSIIVRVIYGAQYLAAIPVVQILSWYTVFAYYGGSKDIWILAEEKQKYLLTLNGVGALANVVLNYALIPYLGARGAALASVITNLFTNVIMISVISPLKYNNTLLLRAVHPKQMVRAFKATNILKICTKR